MPSAFRVRDIDDLEFEDVALHPEGKDGPAPGTATTTREIIDVIFPKKDYEDIARELGCKRNQVSFVVHAETNARGRQVGYRLAGTAGAGDDFDPSQDPRTVQNALMAKLGQR